MTAFRHDDESRMLLCVGAMSEGPAACATEGKDNSDTSFCCNLTRLFFM
jgi:hypothetical protein